MKFNYDNIIVTIFVCAVFALLFFMSVVAVK